MKKKIIMVVDDNPDSQYILDLALRGSGYDVIHVMNGYDALEKLKERKVDLIVSDILMPGMDGFQLCWKIKSDEKTRNIPFMFYTAYYTGKPDENFAMNLGAQKFICKPTDPDIFVEKIKQVIHECEDSKLPSPKCTLNNPETFLKEYVERLKGSIERNVLGVEETPGQGIEEPPPHPEIPLRARTDIQPHPAPDIEKGSYEEAIITALGRSSTGFTTNQLAKNTGISRTTIIKYLSVLKERGITDYVEVGPSKLWFVKIGEKPHSSLSTANNILSI